MTRKLATMLLLAVLAACNTVQGAGKDIQSIGKKGEEVIKK